MYYNNDSVLFFDGEYVKAKEAKTYLYDQSLHYGYAVFERIKPYKIANGTKIFKTEEHYDRLRNSTEIVALASLDNVPFKLNWEESVASKIQKSYRHLVLEEDYSYLKSDPQYV
jgi:branched-chain amino acid aminotransferase